MIRGAVAPLAHREFRLLFLGRLTSLAGSAIAPIALAFAVLELTGSAGDLGLVLAAGFLRAVAAGAALAGVGFEIFGVFWELSLQQHVPRDRLSRVSSYDALGSFVAIPVGQVLAGPLSAAIGVDATIWVAVALYTVPVAACLLVRDVRRLERTDLVLERV